MADKSLRLAHLAALHCGDLAFDGELAEHALGQVEDTGCDLVVVAGGLTGQGYPWEYEQAAGLLEKLSAPVVVVPGSADSRNVGYIHFEELFGERFHRRRIDLAPDRARDVGADGVTVLALDSSEPDLANGRIGREWYPWIRDRFGGDDSACGGGTESARGRGPGSARGGGGNDLEVVLLHHHLVAVPGAGREQTVVEDAGDLLAVLSEVGVDVVLTGAKHVPFFWGVNGMLLANCGTAGTHLIRGDAPPSWNELEVDSDQIRVYVHYPDGARQLAAVRSRSTRSTVQRAFTVTDEFFASNHLPVG